MREFIIVLTKGLIRRKEHYFLVRCKRLWDALVLSKKLAKENKMRFKDCKSRLDTAPVIFEYLKVNAKVV